MYFLKRWNSVFLCVLVHGEQRGKAEWHRGNRAVFSQRSLPGIEMQFEKRQDLFSPRQQSKAPWSLLISLMILNMLKADHLAKMWQFNLVIFVHIWDYLRGDCVTAVGRQVSHSNILKAHKGFCKPCKPITQSIPQWHNPAVLSGPGGCADTRWVAPLTKVFLC